MKKKILVLLLTYTLFSTIHALTWKSRKHTVIGSNPLILFAKKNMDNENNQPNIKNQQYREAYSEWLKIKAVKYYIENIKK